MSLYGLYKAAAVSPRVTVADPEKNAASALTMIRQAAADGAGLVVLPELHLSGYTCADLFFQDALVLGCEKALRQMLEETKDLPAVWLIGLPVRLGEALYNCAAVCQSGKLLGLVPKSYLPNYQEYYEKRWFASGRGMEARPVRFAGQETSFGRQLFRFGEMVLGVELCEDVWVPVPPGSLLCLAGANVIANLSASNELVSKQDYRRDLVLRQSAGCICGYVYASAGPGESTTDMYFSGACMVAENGGMLAENARFEQAGGMAVGCIDVQKLMAERRKNTSFHDNALELHITPPTVVEGAEPDLSEGQVDRRWDPAPFVPKDPAQMERRCREILAIQAGGLAKRLSHTGAKRAVVGISGGLDSTLALIVAVEAMRLTGKKPSDVLAVTMPGFGTTGRTYENACGLTRALGAELKEVDIRPACIQHMKDIGQDPEVHDVTYENTQARQRTYILMDLANKEGGILVGTGDLSELALGWCTYNGDHMSMYGVNASVPKTLVRHLVAYAAGKAEKEGRPEEARLMQAVLDTPVSPELLPPDENGEIAQKTEETVGPYELHDFFLYHFLRFGFPAEKLKFLAMRAFDGKYPEAVIDKWLENFYRRFFASQFKRSCVPDSPKVGSVSLSPRGDWRMPSDASREAWLRR